ncbi:ComEC/Rec2 family competence protein [Pseudoroseomonas cervicalis]|uniref:ComEC/Rec2 family competence protein n=1 Tax=Teichococcus cervicalis TaxID=204525 RepID=UPI0022F18150|nr:ComEC/Rec2 family competence protein [Pseudoroseomonas cervicalis]WBV41412.1 ComEC/Rec2 family competence protein [Pseudoroseomonas cervicalis]
MPSDHAIAAPPPAAAPPARFGRGLAVAGQRLATRVSAWLEAEWARLPLWWPVALAAGLLLYFALPAEPSAAWLGLAPPLLGAALWLGLRGRPLAGWGLGLLGCAVLGFGWGAWQAARQPPPLDLPARAVLVQGEVAAVEQLPGALRVTLRNAVWAEGAAPAPRLIRLRLRAEDPLRPWPGEVLRVRALLRPPPAPAAPGAWDFQRDAFFSGLGGSGFAIGAAERVSARAEGGDGLAAALRARLERRVMDSLAGAGFSNANGAISAAMFTGSQAAIPAEAMQAMRDSGLAHLLSVSGLHVSIVMGLGFAGTRFLLALWPALALRLDSKRVAAPVGLLLGFLYVLLTGLQVPMLRSFGMAALVTLGVLMGRRALSLRALALAAAIVMLMAPQALLGPSFQMSFAAVLVLIAGAEATAPRLAAWRRAAAARHAWLPCLIWPLGLMLTSLLAGLATLPYGLHHFGRLQLYGLAANMVAVPLTSFLVMPAGLAAMLAWPLGLEEWPLQVMGWGVEGVLWVARSVAAWPGAALPARPMPGWGLGLLSLGLVWLCLWRRRWRLWGLPLIALGLLSALAVRPPDILVSADARLIAFRTGAGVALQRQPGGTAFLRESWLRGWGRRAAAPCRSTSPACRACPATPAPAASSPTPRGRRRCCCARRARHGRHRAAGSGGGSGAGRAPRRARLRPGSAAALGRADPGALRGKPRAGPLQRLARRGPRGLAGPRGAEILSDRAWRGARPWVPPRPVPRSRAGAAPAAGAEAAPLSSGAADPPDDPAP